MSPGSICHAHLRSLGQAMLIYSNDFGGRLPDRLSELGDEYVSTYTYVCPASGDTPAARGPTTRATTANIDSGGHVSYLYFGKGRTNNLGADFVLACEPLSNHAKAGMHVLYGDGHVDWLPAPEASRVLSEVNSGHNPPRDPSTQPAPPHR